MKTLEYSKNSGLHKIKIWVLVLLTVAVSVFIWGNSVASVEQSVEISGGIMKVIKEIVDPADKIDVDVFHHTVRKTAHFIEFFFLGILYMLIKNSIDGKIVGSLTFFPLFVTLITAVIDEFIQFFADRGSDVKDVVLDFSGAVAGIVVAGIILWLISVLKCNKLTEKK